MSTFTKISMMNLKRFYWPKLPKDMDNITKNKMDTMARLLALLESTDWSSFSMITMVDRLFSEETSTNKNFILLQLLLRNQEKIV